MGSNINIAVVQRHLDSVGHRLSSRNVADLLRDLGFSVNAEKEEEQVRLVQEQRHTEQARKIGAERTTFSPNKTFKAVSAPAATATASTAKNNRVPVHSVGVTSLAAKLDALEAQINEINDLQAHLNHKLDTEQQRVAKKSTSDSMASLGTEAEQLKDWAAGKWPNLRHYNSVLARNTSSDSSHSSAATTDSNTDEASVQNNQQQQHRPRSRNSVVLKKRDPVARYQEIQKIWSRDPFLCSGAGDAKSSQRKEQGFRERFSANHTKK